MSVEFPRRVSLAPFSQKLCASDRIIRRDVRCTCKRSRLHFTSRPYPGKTSVSRARKERRVASWPFVCAGLPLKRIAEHCWKKMQIDPKGKTPVFPRSDIVRNCLAIGCPYSLVHSIFLSVLSFFFLCSLFKPCYPMEQRPNLHFPASTGVFFSRSWIMDRHEKLLHTHRRVARGPN